MLCDFAEDAKNCYSGSRGQGQSFCSIYILKIWTLILGWHLLNTPVTPKPTVPPRGLRAARTARAALAIWLQVVPFLLQRDTVDQPFETRASLVYPEKGTAGVQILERGIYLPKNLEARLKETRWLVTEARGNTLFSMFLPKHK